MYKYEKIEYDNNLPTKLHDFFVENSSGVPIDKHWHRGIEIIVPLYGTFNLWINGDMVRIIAGKIYIINSQDIHAVHVIEGEEVYKGYALQIGYDYLKECYHDIDQMLVFLLLDNLAKEKRDYIELKDNKYKNRIINIIKYMETNYQEDLSVDNIAERFEISNGYLSKLFKDNLDVTVKEYLTRLRLWHAEEELISTDYPVIDIALNNGFPNVKSFNQTFKRKYFLTPAKYREKMRK